MVKHSALFNDQDHRIIVTQCPDKPHKEHTQCKDGQISHGQNLLMWFIMGYGISIIELIIISIVCLI